MAGSMELAKILEPTELQSLSDEIRHKLNTSFEKTNTYIDEIRASYEKLRVNSEQQYFEIEKQLTTTNSKLEAELDASRKLKEQHAELERKYHEASEKLKHSQDAEGDNLSTQLRLTKVNEQLEGEKREMAILLEKRSREIDTLNDELRQISKKLSETNLAKFEAIAKLDVVKSDEVNREFQTRRYEQERDNLQKQVDWLNKEMEEKTKELMIVRREKSTKLLDLQTQLESKTEECSLLSTTVDNLKTTVTEQAQKIDTYIQRIKDIQESNSQGEEQYKQEIQARIRLADLYKTSADEAETKSSELLGAVQELQTLLKEAAQAHTDMENEKNEEIEKLQETFAEKDSKIESLEQELVNANDLLSTVRNKSASEEMVETMFPTAAATSRLLRSGMTLTEIYNEYVQVTDALQVEKDENKRLNLYLDQILREIEDKAPRLKKQKEDYEIALRSIDQMTRQLDAALLERQTLRTEADENHRKAAHLVKENSKFEQTIRDLSQQVKYLVKEVEELRGGRVVRDEDVSSTEISSSSSIISGRLVSFRNIDELQEQNQKLLSVIRELSAKQEQEESMAIDSRTRELKEQLEEANEELSRLKESRLQQTEMIESIVRQRDMYRILLQQANAEEVSMTSFSKSGSSKTPEKPALKSPGVDRAGQRQLEDSTRALKQLQEEFSTYKKEKFENDKLTNDQLEENRKELGDLRIQNAKLSSQLEYAAERNKVSLSNIEGYKREIKVLQDKVQKYGASIAKYEQTINSQRQELMGLQEQVSQAQAKAENVRSERDIIRASEQRLLVEIGSMRRERQTQTMLMANLQAIQNNLERAENETKHRLTVQIEELEREKNTLKNNLQLETKQAQTLTSHFEHQVQELRSQLEQEIKSHQTSKDKCAHLDKSCTENMQQITNLTAKVSSLESKLATGSSTGVDPSESLLDYKSQLEQAKSEVDSLKDQLQKSRAHVDQYKGMAASLQQMLKQEKESSTDFKDTLEQKLKIAKEKCQHLQQQNKSLEDERHKLLEENFRVNEDSHKLNAELRTKLAELENELQESNERRETAIAIEMSAKQECDQQTCNAREAQDKYERELMLHAADVEALTALKRKLEGFNSQLNAKEEECRTTGQRLTELERSSKLREEMLTEEKNKLASRLEDTLQETRALHQQMNKLSSQVISAQEKAVFSPRPKPGSSTTTATAAALDDDSAKSVEQLLEVNRYIRKQKSIAEGKLDVVETECSRLKQRCEALERQLESVNTQLADEREQAQAGLQTAAQHAELMHRVESYNLLHDSNKLLREERDQLQTKQAEAEAKLSKLEEIIRPLQADIRDLQSQRDALTTDKMSLNAEMERWKARTNQLIEQSHKTDPEEHKRLMQEKEEFRSKNNTLTEELHKVKTDLTKGSLEMAKLQRQLGQLKDENTRQSGEIEKLKASVDEKDKDAGEKMKTVNQLRAVGRRYKTQAETLQKEIEEFKAGKENEQSAQAAAQASAEQVKDLEQKLKEANIKTIASDVKFKEATNKINDLEASLKNIKEEIEKLTQENGKLTETIKETSEKLQKAEEQVVNMQSENTLLKADIARLSEENSKLLTDKGQMASNEQAEVSEVRAELASKEADLREKAAQIETKTQELRALEESMTAVNREKAELKLKSDRLVAALQNAKSKLTSMKEINEKLTTERTDLIKRTGEAEERAATLKSQLDHQTQRLDQEREQSTKEASELQNKIQHLQKQLEGSGATPVQVTRSAGSVVQERVSSTPIEPVKTANIRPTASSSPASYKPQTVPVQPQSAASKVTASIRPMTIPQVTTSTPTATVMPTTVSQTDIFTEEEAMLPIQQQLFPQQGSVVAGARQVHRVIPTQETLSVESVSDPSMGQSDSGFIEPQQSTSRETPVTSIQQSAKRMRDESPGDDAGVKRSKVTVAESSPAEVPDITITDESSLPDHGEIQWAEVAPTQQVEVEPEEEGEPDTCSAQEALDMEAATQPVDEGVQDGMGEEETGVDVKEADEGEAGEGQSGEEEAVIVVGSDEEEDDDDNDDDAEARREAYEDGHDIYQGIDDNDDQQQGADDDVVIIDEDDDDDQALSSQTSGSQQTSQASSSVELVPSLPPIQPPERQFSSSGNLLTPSLAPFMLSVHHAGFEDVDDSLVPSTPTLHVPRRGDGFAEAVSSPQVSRMFVFGHGRDQQPGLSLSGLTHLDTQPGLGMGMDDTRFDLTQLEYPSTPLHTSAPVAISTDGQPQLSQSDSALGDEGSQEGQEEGQYGEGEAYPEELPEDNLEGEQGEEDSQEDWPQSVGNVDDIQSDLEEMEEDDSNRQSGAGKEGADGGAEGSSSRDDTSSMSADRSQDNKPKIQKIVWEDPSKSHVTPSPNQSVSQPTQAISVVTGPPPQQFRARGAPHRGRFLSHQARGAPQGGFQPRGQRGRPMRGRGMNYPRRPNMY